MQAAAVVSLSPSFSSYSNPKLVEIAARVVEEFRADEGENPEDLYDEFYFERKAGFESVNEGADNDEEGEFEFAIAAKDSESSPITADEMFDNGKIRPFYPIFKGDLSLGSDAKVESESKKENETKSIRLPLSQLFIEEKETETTSSSSSSDADDLEGVPEKTYCVWRPKSPAHSPLKSSSTGSTSKRWKLIDLLHRSQSEGSDGVVSSPRNGGRKRGTDANIKGHLSSAKMKLAASPPSPYHRVGGEKRRTYLPYRQDLVGFFSNASPKSKFAE